MKHLYKTSLFLLIWIVSALLVDAAPISRQQALQNAQVFLENKGRNDAAPTLSLVTSKSLNTSQEKYYVFNIGNEDGYVIAAGDDCAPAILGYADTGYIDLDSLPVNLKSWLEEYAQQIQFMQENGYSPSKAPKLTSSYSAISPLLTTTWDQLDPYNQNCPDFFSYGKCVTGCVATAMAQVMYYHRARSVTQTTAQIPAYTCRHRWISGTDTMQIHVDAIPAGSPIDWNNMLDNYGSSATTTQEQAVANLMKYCGASVQMDYANEWNGGSGAYSSDVPIALKSYFNYSDETTLQYRSNYSSDAAWESLVYTELSSSRPVYYSGSNSSGGHAFVCDGYDGSGYYHINWGWSGTSDGYFLLTALDPNQQGTGGSSSGYNQNQAALINAQPKSSSPSNPVLATSISLNKTSAELTEGYTMQLTATVLPSNATNKAVTWTTSNSSVATVNSNGLVTAKSPGNATITATTTDGSNLSASCSVTVKQNVVLATSISLNKTSAELTEGYTMQLTATVLPSNATNKAVTWTTSNSSVATVSSNGLVIANNPGAAIITARTTDGSNLSASCSVTVKQDAVLATSISLNKTSAEINTGGTLQLSATVLPGNTTNKTVTWSTSNSSVATVSYGLVSAKAVGTATITAMTTDGSNLSATCVINVININNEDLAIGEWAWLPTGEPATVGQTTNDHLFVRNTYNDMGTSLSYDNVVSFKSGKVQTVWFWLDDDEIYLNNKVQALTPMAINSAGDLYNEITYNSLQCELYLPMSMRMIMTENEDGDEVAYLQGDRMPNTTDFSFSEKAETKVVDGKEYRVYAIVLSSTKAFGSHFSSKNANGYKNNGPLKKDDAPLFGIFIENDNQDQAEGRVDNMIIANTEFGIRECVAAGWEPNDYRFIYGTGGNNESQRFQLYNCVALYGNTGIDEEVLATSISLNMTSADLNTGETLQLTATVLPVEATNKTVVWTTSNSSVASVSSDGVVTAIAPGTATITASTNDGSNLNSSCSLTVRQSSTILATSISLNKTIAELKSNETLQLAASVLPENASNKTVVWISSNSSVATVSSNGVVTAHSLGTTTIIARTVDGSNLSASCNVIVMPPDTVLATSITLNFKGAKMITGRTLQLSATIQPSYTTNKTVTWTTSNSSVATVSSNGLVTAKAAGTATITAMTTDGSNLSATCVINVININNNEDLAIGEWAWLPTGEPATVGQTTNDHLFVRNTYNDMGTTLSYDNVVSFKSGKVQTVWFWLDDDEIYLNNKVQALTPMALNSAGDLYNEITYNSLQCELYLPMSMEMIMTENEDGDEVAYLQGDRMPNTTDFSFYEKSETKVVDGKEYRVYGIVLTNAKAFGSHFSSKNANGYKNNGPLKKDDAPLFGIFIQNNNQDQAEGRVDDMIIANIEFGFREGVAAGWEPNDYRFIYGTGGNNESQRFQLYNRVALYGGIGIDEDALATSISLNMISAELTEGNTMQLSATVLPSNATNKTVTWTTSNSSVATVSSNGLVTAKSPGNATITATTTDGSNLSASCSVTVKQNVVLATSISLNKTSAELTEGYSMQLSATVLPSNATNKTVTWTTSNSSVATVSSNGLVTAKNPGTAIITARTTDGSNLSASCSVTVKQNVVLATSISLNKTSAELAKGYSIQLTATVLPSNATNKTVTWKSSNTSVATVSSNGLVTAKSSGTATITATTTDGTNLSASCEVTVTEDISNYDNYLTISDAEAFHGDTIVIPVTMTNAQSILSFQTDIYLPEGLEVVQEDGEYVIDPSERMTRTHSIMSNTISNGAIRVLCYSSNYKPFTGNSGDDLFYITVKVADDAEGDYSVSLRNTLFTTSNFEEVAGPDVTANLHVNSYLLGDANGSGTVTVTDVVVTSQYVLELNPQPFIFEAADVNADNNITVTDVTRIAWMVLNPTLNMPMRAPAIYNNSDRMSGKNITLMPGETRTVSILLDNEMDYSAFQFDLNLPEGLTASNFLLTERTGNHAFDVNALGNGKMRVLCYSPALEVINGHNGALLTFDVTANSAIEDAIDVDGIELVTSACQTVKLNGFAIGVNTVSSVNELGNGKTFARVDYFNMAGQQIDHPDSGVTLVVTTYTDGTRTTRKIIR